MLERKIQIDYELLLASPFFRRISARTAIKKLLLNIVLIPDTNRCCLTADV